MRKTLPVWTTLSIIRAMTLEMNHYCQYLYDVGAIDDNRSVSKRLLNFARDYYKKEMRCDHVVL